MDTHLNKIQGALWGTVLGDALGLPFEGVASRDLVSLRSAVDRRIERTTSWGYSDDSEMMLLLAQSLIEAGSFDPCHVVHTLAHHHDPARGYGKGTRRLLEAYLRGTHMADLPTCVWPDGSKATGGTVRLPPLVCWYAHNPVDNLSRQIERATACTHAHPEALQASQLFGHSLHWLLLHPPTTPREVGASLLAYLDQQRLLLPHAYGHTSIKARLTRWLHAPFDASALIADFGHGLLAREAVPCALACVLGASSFEQAVTHAVYLGGDTDTIAALTGALSGALMGLDALALGWRQRLHHEPRLHIIDTFSRALCRSK
ncbi:MAG: ADP-ribosylglycohydrolase family protein [Myxococcota bacterium]